MTAEEIRAKKFVDAIGAPWPVDPAAAMLQEIAAQLAESVAQSKAHNDRIMAVFDEVASMLPKMKKIFDDYFASLEEAANYHVSAVSPGVAAMATIPAQLPADFEQLVVFVKARGYSDEAARTIVGNHAAAIRADLQAAEKGAASGAEEKEKENKEEPAPAPPAESGAQ